MSRSGYYEVDEIDPLELGRWRGRVASATRGKRGQALLKGILAAMDAMPEKKLYPSTLINDGFHDETYESEYQATLIVGGDEIVDESGKIYPMGAVCAMGAFAKARGLDTSKVNPESPEQVARLFRVAEPLVREIASINDDDFEDRDETPEQRFIRMRQWIASQIKDGAA